MFFSLEIDPGDKVGKYKDFLEVHGQVSTERQVSASTEEPPEQAERFIPPRLCRKEEPPRRSKKGKHLSEPHKRTFHKTGNLF